MSPLNRTPPQSRSQSRSQSRDRTATPSDTSAPGHGPGRIATAINLLPVDVGTSISPTVFRPNPASGSTICTGGPGNTACDLEVKDDQQGVWCDLCGNWYHAFCQDITKAAYNALKKHKALSFICDSCKKLPNLANLQPRPHLMDAATQASPVHDNTQSTSEHVISDLVKKVGDLELVMKRHLTATTSDMIQWPNSSHGPPHPPKDVTERSTYAETLRENTVHQHHLPQRHDHLPAQSVPPTRTFHQGSQDYRRVVREELRELEERKKRQHSLVIRGLRVKTAAEAVARFGEITEFLTGERITLSEVCQIKSDTDLFRGNVHDIRQRNLVLEHARNLRNTQYSDVYIRKDLTFIQRQELHDRLSARTRQTEWHRTTPSQPIQNQLVVNSSRNTNQPSGMVDTVPKQLVSDSNTKVAPPCTPPREEVSVVAENQDPRATQSGPSLASHQRASGN